LDANIIMAQKRGEQYCIGSSSVTDSEVSEGSAILPGCDIRGSWI